MAFPDTFEISRQFMVTMLCFKRLIKSQFFNDIFQKRNVQPPLPSKFHSRLKTRCLNKLIDHYLQSSRSSLAEEYLFALGFLARPFASSIAANVESENSR